MLQVIVVEPLLADRGPPCADDSNGVFVTLGPYDEHKPALDRADGDEPVLEIGMVFVEDLDVATPDVKSTRAS